MAAASTSWQWYDTPHAAHYQVCPVGDLIDDVATYGASVRDMPRPIDWLYRGGRRPKFTDADGKHPWNLQALALFRSPRAPVWESDANRGCRIAILTWERDDDGSTDAASQVQDCWELLLRILPSSPAWVVGSRVVDKSSRRRGTFYRIEIWCEQIATEDMITRWVRELGSCTHDRAVVFRIVE